MALNLLADWMRLHAMRVDGKRPVGTVFIGDQEKEVEFARHKGLFALYVPWRGELPDMRCLHGLDLIVCLKGRRFSGEDGVRLLQTMVAANPRSMLAKRGWSGATQWVVSSPEILPVFRATRGKATRSPHWIYPTSTGSI